LKGYKKEVQKNYQNEHGHGDDQLVLREVVLLDLEHQLLRLAFSNNTNFPETNLPSISSTLNARIFRTNVVFLVTFWLWGKNLFEKFAHKMLMKLTPEDKIKVKQIRLM
jgi:hypothetical protein